MASKRAPDKTDRTSESSSKAQGLAADSTELAEMPIPSPEPHDLEDVSAALSTARTSWSRGDAADAMKWLRRAAEAATEASANARALVLARAAAMLATRLGRESALPPTYVPGGPSTAPSEVVATARSAAPPAPPRPAPSKGSGLKNAVPPSKLPIGGPNPASTLASKGNEARKERKSGHSLEREGRLIQASDSSTVNSAMLHRRSSHPGPMAPEGDENGVETLARPPSLADAIDSWPTESMKGIELSHLTEEMAKNTPASVRAVPLVPELPRPLPAAPVAHPPLLRPAQAVRVILWQTPEGLRVAPAGTPIAGPTLEAILVGVDPKSDLVGWLSRK